MPDDFVLTNLVSNLSIIFGSFKALESWEARHPVLRFSSLLLVLSNVNLPAGTLYVLDFLFVLLNREVCVIRSVEFIRYLCPHLSSCFSSISILSVASDVRIVVVVELN